MNRVRWLKNNKISLKQIIKKSLILLMVAYTARAYVRPTNHILISTHSV